VVAPKSTQQETEKPALPGGLPDVPTVPDAAVPLPPGSKGVEGLSNPGAPASADVPLPGFPGKDKRTVTVAQAGDKDAQKAKTPTEGVQPPAVPPNPSEAGVSLPPEPPGPLSTEEILKKEKARADGLKTQNNTATTPGQGGVGVAEVPVPAGGPASVPQPGSNPPDPDSNKKAAEASQPPVLPVAQGSKPGPVGDWSKPLPTIPPEQQLVKGPTAGNAGGVAAPSAADVAQPGKQTGVVPGSPTEGTPPPPAVATGTNQPGTRVGPLGAEAEATGPPIRVPGPSESAGAVKAPQVRDYFSKTFRCTDQVRTFDGISKQAYGHEKYALALLLFNRDVPGLEAVRDGAAPLAVGQSILLPPAGILEDRYPAEIRDYRPAPPPAIANGPPVAVPPPATPPVASTGKAGGGPDYRVQGNGEMLYEIARNTLGDGKRWPEIYRLNPAIQPQLAIPAGTVLHLPLGARIGTF
jgi:hypothetical protein